MENKSKPGVLALFFDNIHLKQTLAKNTFWLTVGEIGSRALKFILLVYIARMLGANDYGKFSFALAFVLLLQNFSDFGISQIVTREFAKDKEREKDLPSLLSLKILLSLAVLVLIVVSSFFITSDPEIRKIIFILALSNLISIFSMIFYAVFEARQKMEYECLIRTLEALILLVIGFIVLFFFPSIVNITYGYLIASIFTLIVILFVYHGKFQKISINWDKSIWRKFLSLSWPLALVGVFNVIYNETDSVMLGSWGQITQNGWYNAGYRLITIFTIPIGIISTSFFPVLSQKFKETKEEFQKIWNYQTEVMILLAMPLMIGGIVLAKKIIEFTYNSNYAPAIPAFQMLIVMAGIMFFYSNFRWALIVANHQKKLFWVVLSGAIVNVILNAILIPRFSLYGAAAATVFTHLLVLILLLGFTLKLKLVNPFNSKIMVSLIGAVLCSLIMYFAIIQAPVYNLNLILIVLIGTGVYAISFLGYKKLTSKIVKKTIK